MAQIQVRCPGCGKRYQINGSLQVLQTQPFVCRGCGFRVPFSSLYNLQNGGKVVNTPPPPPPPPMQVTPGQSKKTKIFNGADGGQPMAPPAQSPNKTKVLGAFLVVPSAMRQLRLTSGTYVLGRLSSDSPADLKIAPDPYMSRQHAMLKVDVAPGRERYLIKSLKDENLVYVNQIPIPIGKMASLKNGDVLTMGRTQVKFVKK